MLTTLLNQSNPLTNHYRFKQIASLGGHFNYGRAINANNVIAGDAYLEGDTIQHAFFLKNGRVNDIGQHAVDVDTIAQDLNNHDLIVGHTARHNSELSKRTHEAFYYDNQTHSFQTLGTLGGESSYAYGVNDAKQIVGYSHTTQGHEEAFVYDTQRHQMNRLGTLGGLQSVAHAINNAGQIVGHSSVNITDTHAFVITQQHMQDIGTLGGASSYAYDINDHGMIVGSAYNQHGEDHAFLYDPNRRPCMLDLGTLGGAVSVANAVNNHNQVVGYSFLTNNTDAHAFIFQYDRMLDLNLLMDQTTRKAGWVLNEALDINDNGSIIGIAYNEKLSVPSCAFLLEIDQPAENAYVRFLTHLGFRFSRHS